VKRTSSTRSRFRGTIKSRVRVVTIVSIPSIALLFVGACLAAYLAYLVNQGIEIRIFAVRPQAELWPITPVVTAPLLLGGVTIFVVAAVVLLVAVRLSRRMLRRLTRLSQATSHLAHRELPELVRRLRAGEPVDLAAEVPWLEHGEDEIGQLASAVNTAQRTAITATVHEAETRQGVAAVFVNIAHRSQVLVHQQLKVLDDAERSLEDAEQLQVLFQLDHLATRSRRHAENLLILGGSRAGRQWRQPVAMREMLRSAISETEQYARVSAIKLPDVSVVGAAVADLIHLLAELVDNATAFSPPQSQVVVRSNVVGRGVVVEIEDQGLGIEPERLQQINAVLSDPPDFSVMALSTEPRIGLFVVAQLAARHHIKITLRESVYDGVCAIVVIPKNLIAEEEHDTDSDDSADAVTDSPGAKQQAQPVSGQASANGQRQLPVRHRADTLTVQAGQRPFRLAGDLPSGPAAPSANGHPSDHDVAVATPGELAAEGAAPAMLSTNGHPLGRSSFAPPCEPDADGGSNGAAPSSLQARTNGSAAFERPPLPLREPQASLAPQLCDDPAEPEPSTEDSSVQPHQAERSRMNMAAFQDGTRRARDDDSDLPDPQTGESG
jgi:signal transduction histidine kinase